MKNLINEFIEHEKTKGRKAQSTIRNYQMYLGRFSDFTGNIKPEEISLDLIDKFQKEIAKNASISTQSYYLIAIRVFLKWLRVRKDIQALDPEKIELPKINRKIQDALTDKEVDQLLKAVVPQRRTQIEDRAMLELMVGSGIRVGELVKLRVQDIDFENKTFIVNGKGNKDRLCFLTNSACHFLQKHLGVRKSNSPLLFEITPRSVQRMVQRTAQEAGIKKRVTPHTLRRTFGAIMLNHGADVRHVQDFLGHSNIQTTQFYTQISKPDLKKVFRLANTKMVKNTPSGVKNEFVVMSKDNFYKLTGMIGHNQKLLSRICEKLKIKTN
jgi:integrase/recombinase XerD